MQKSIHIKIIPDIPSINRIQEALRVALGLSSAGHSVFLSIEATALSIWKADLGESEEKCAKYFPSLKKFGTTFSQDWELLTDEKLNFLPGSSRSSDFMIRF